MRLHPAVWSGQAIPESASDLQGDSPLVHVQCVGKGHRKFEAETSEDRASNALSGRTGSVVMQERMIRPSRRRRGVFQGLEVEIGVQCRPLTISIDDIIQRYDSH